MVTVKTYRSMYDTRTGKVPEFTEWRTEGDGFVYRDEGKEGWSRPVQGSDAIAQSLADAGDDRAIAVRNRIMGRGAI